MDKQISLPLKKKTKLLAGIIIVLVIVIGFLGYYITQMAPTEEKPIISASEASERISDLQEQLQTIADDLKGISEEL